MDAEIQSFPIKEVLSSAFMAPITFATVLVAKSIPAVIALVGSFLLLFGGISLAFANLIHPLLLFPVGLLCMFGGLFGQTILVESLHRIFLLGPDSIPGRGFRRWTYRDTRFVGWGFVLGTLVTVVMAPGFFFLIVQFPDLHQISPVLDRVDNLHTFQIRMMVVFFLAWIPGGYVASRLAFVLPATAIGFKPNLGWSFNLTRPYQGSAFLMVGMVPILFQSGNFLLVLLLPGVLSGIASLVFSVYQGVLMIALLSFSFRFLAEAQPGNFQPRITDGGKLIDEENA